MKKILTIFMLTGALLQLTARASVGVCRHTNTTSIRDSIVTLPSRENTSNSHRRMSTSAYPVQLTLIGNSVRVKSPENQILPVYTHTGAFYLFVRLNKGVNWLNGLPPGRYFINHRLVIIK